MWEFALRIGAVILTVLIAFTPWLYPNYSVFVRRATDGISTLKNERINDGSIEAGYIERGERGFSEVKKAAEVAYGLHEDVERICVAWGSPPDIAEFVGMNQRFTGIGDNGLVYAKNANGELIQLRYRPGAPNQTRRLEDLYGALSVVAQQRGQKLTGSLAIIWATITIVIVAM